MGGEVPLRIRLLGVQWSPSTTCSTSRKRLLLEEPARDKSSQLIAAPPGVSLATRFVALSPLLKTLREKPIQLFSADPKRPTTKLVPVVWCAQSPTGRNYERQTIPAKRLRQEWAD